MAAVVALGACAKTESNKPLEQSSTSVVEVEARKPKERALRLMFDQEAVVIQEGVALLKPVQGDRLVLDPYSTTPLYGGVEHVRKSADIERQAATDMVGAALHLKYDTEKDLLTIDLGSFTANAENGELQTENYHSARWRVEDEDLKRRAIDGRASCGELLERLELSYATLDRDTPDVVRFGLKLVEVWVSVAHAPDDRAAGYERSEQCIINDEQGLECMTWAYRNKPSTPNQQSAMYGTEPERFASLIDAFAAHSPYAQDAITVAIG